MLGAPPEKRLPPPARHGGQSMNPSGSLRSLAAAFAAAMPMHCSSSPARLDAAAWSEGAPLGPSMNPTQPVPTSAGGTATICVSDHDCTWATEQRPLRLGKYTLRPLGWLAPNPLPCIETVVPAQPTFGLSAVIPAAEPMLRLPDAAWPNLASASWIPATQPCRPSGGSSSQSGISKHPSESGIGLPRSAWRIVQLKASAPRPTCIRPTKSRSDPIPNAPNATG